jgi:hypothetical protein
LNRAWKKSSPFASALAIVFLIPPGAQQGKAPRRANELALAGLRPGKDTLAAAKKLYGEQHVVASPDDNAWTWKNVCEKRALRIEPDGRGVVQFITVSAEDEPDEGRRGDCGEKPEARRHSEMWRTGKGLALGDSRERVVALYGAPNSGGPSTGGNRELELMFYAFDWAGSDVPQVMEVYCDRATSRVVQITLAFPSL